MIIDLEKYTDRFNGRLDLHQPDPEAQFQLFEKVAIKNKATEYRAPLDGVWENNVLSQVFFSKENIQILQNGIRAGVYKMSSNKFFIPPQNQDQLKIVMRSTYLQYAKHRKDDIRGQVQALNDLVWDYCIPYVYNECVAYMKYLQDQSTIAMPLERSMQPDRDHKQLELKPWF
jgi:Family of unknown function (DUF5761)